MREAVLALFMVFAWSSSASAAPIKDADTFGSISGGAPALSTQWLGQVVTAGIAGTLMQVELSLARRTDQVVDDVMFEVRDVSNGMPGANVLFSYVIDVAAMPISVLGIHRTVSVDVSGADLTFDAGDMFAVVLGRAPGTSGALSNWPLWSYGEDFSGAFSSYSGVGSWNRWQTDSAFALRTFLEPTAVPEPGMLSLFGVALAYVGLTRRRSRSL